MALHVNSVTFDASDPTALAGFWGAVFELEPEVASPYVAFVRPDDGPHLMFIQVPESKSAKNRVHLDLHADDEAGVDRAVSRLTAKGASVVDSHREYGVYWTTLQDPEGNELCIGTPLPGHGQD